MRTRDQTHKAANRVDPVDHPISDLEAGYLLLDRNHQFETVKPISPKIVAEPLFIRQMV